ncbi:helix-turn-helix domain-containing protein [Streptomyces sp. NBC_01264]|uniref:helix-turn-helix domain-containing protein n=1 Tax=Streptomyces sp. NBC_01264 TaxID=2903804 RepID=UPI002255D98A|nr:helix-turn-helix domain-containing protein [Streptomyces sp. NBC_01264]MCX4780916.1 helix-turn-helix domain containing protein [Streptomyces sp. NBC_01264]
MITDADLPTPWRTVASPIDQKQATALDAVAGLQTGLDDLALVSWDLIENADTGRRIMLRMGSGASGVEITGIYVPGPSPVGIGELRNIPLPAIEAAVRARTARATAEVGAALAAGLDADEGPLGNPAGPNDTRFYGRLALRYLRVAGTSHRPATDLAKEEGVTPRTVQRWISHARELGLLPPGRKGRAS